MSQAAPACPFYPQALVDAFPSRPQRAAMGKRKAWGPVASLIAGEAAALVALHRLGAEPFMQIPWSDIDGWLRSADPADALAAALRLAVLASRGG